MRPAAAPRTKLPFRAVNRPGEPDFDSGLQRHHLLLCQLLGQRCFGRLLEAIGTERVGFDDFRSNGLLLPASDAGALRLGLPLHRGPHRHYNAVVIERVGQVEARWASTWRAAPNRAREEALMRLGLLQRALRRRLLDRRRLSTPLNRFDPVARDLDFSELEAMADALWPATEWQDA